MKKDSGGWIVKKLRKIYIPFLIINILSIIFVYGIHGNSQNIIERIILGTDDYVMWYIPFVLCFSICFFIIYNINVSKINRLILFGITCAVQIVAFEWINIGSQWYTATGALFLGVFVAEYPVSNNRSNNILGFIISIVVFVASGIGSKLYVDYNIVKDCLTCISGMAFCFGLMIIFERIEALGRIKNLYFLRHIGNASLWGYILHMKVLNLLCRYVGKVNVYIYIVNVYVAMMIFDLLWKKMTFTNRKYN